MMGCISNESRQLEKTCLKTSGIVVRCSPDYHLTHSRKLLSGVQLHLIVSFFWLLYVVLFQHSGMSTIFYASKCCPMCFSTSPIYISEDNHLFCLFLCCSWIYLAPVEHVWGMMSKDLRSASV